MSYRPVPRSTDAVAPERARRAAGPSSLGRDAHQPAAVDRRHRARSRRSPTQAGALLVVDNTFASPVPAAAARARRGRRGALHHQVPRRPLRRGRRRADRRPTQASASDLRFLQNATGAVAGPFDAWLTLRGIKTLAVRMDRHCANAARVADMLAGHPAVDAGVLPGPGRAPRPRGRAAKQMRDFGGMVSFRVRGGERGGRRGLRPDPAVHPRGVARRGGVADRASGPDDARLGGRLAARGARRPDQAVGRHRGRAEDLLEDLRQALAGM